MKSFLNIELNWKNIFRTLLCTILLIDVISIFLPSHQIKILSMSLMDARHILPVSAFKAFFRLMIFVVCIGLLFIIIEIVSLIGLWKFRKSARQWFIAYYLFNILFNLTFLPTIRYWWDLPIDIIYDILCVAVIVFSYSSYTKQYFNKDKSVASVTEGNKIDSANNVA